MINGETLGLRPILQEARIPFVTPSSTNPAVTDEACDVCNRVALNDKLQGDTDAEYVFDTLGISNVAIMHDSTDYGLGLAELFRAHFEELGGTVTAFEGAQVGDADFCPVLLEISTGSPDLIFFGGHATEAGLIVIQMDEVGLGDTIFFSDDGAYTQQYLDVAGAAADGSYTSFVSGDEVAEANAAFDAKYEDKFGVTPDEMGPFHAQSYDTTVLLGDAIARVAQAIDDGYLLINREELIAAIRETSGLQGLTGAHTCSAIGECGSGGIQIYKVTDGAFVQVYVSVWTTSTWRLFALARSDWGRCSCPSLVIRLPGESPTERGADVTLPTWPTTTKRYQAR